MSVRVVSFARLTLKIGQSALGGFVFLRIVGFDEGPKSPRWREEFREGGIGLREGICRGEVIRVLRVYAEQGRIIYNARQE